MRSEGIGLISFLLVWKRTARIRRWALICDVSADVMLDVSTTVALLPLDTKLLVGRCWPHSPPLAATRSQEYIGSGCSPLKWNPWRETTLMRDHPDERSLQWETTPMRDYTDERQPRWNTTRIRGHPDVRPPRWEPSWWKTTQVRDQPDERPPRWETILMKNHPSGRLPWWKTALMRGHPDEKHP